MAKNSTSKINIGGSAFWLVIFLASFVGLSYLAIWSFHNNSIKGIAVSFIFSFMIIAGILLSKLEIFNSGTWGQNCISFMIGLILWLFIGGSSSKSILAIGQNSLFASISSELPVFLEFVLNTFVIPIAEELFWIVAIPYTVITIMNIAGTKISFLKNIWIQIFVVTVITGLTFAIFHVGKMFLLFLIAAFLFRAIMIIAVYGDMQADIIPGLTLLPAFAVGAHIGNNWADAGFAQGVAFLAGNYEIGWIIIAFLLIVAFSALWAIISFVTKKTKALGA